MSNSSTLEVKSRLRESRCGASSISYMLEQLSYIPFRLYHLLLSYFTHFSWLFAGNILSTDLFLIRSLDYNFFFRTFNLLKTKKERQMEEDRFVHILYISLLFRCAALYFISVQLFLQFNLNSSYLIIAIAFSSRQTTLNKVKLRYLPANDFP